VIIKNKIRFYLTSSKTNKLEFILLFLNLSQKVKLCKHLFQLYLPRNLCTKLKLNLNFKKSNTQTCHNIFFAQQGTQEN
jgi:hypothetical protein